MDQSQEQAIAQRIVSGLSESQEARQKGQWNIDNWIEYWRAVSTNPTNQWYDTNAVRDHGRLDNSQGTDPSMRVSINYIAQEVLNMVASDLLNPLRWRVRFRMFDPEQMITLNQGMDGVPLEISPDKYSDRIHDVISDYLSKEKLDINDARLRLYNLRYKEGSAYLALDWDADGGPKIVFPKRKNGEKWDVLSGNWTEDGQYFQIPKPPLQVSLSEWQANPEGFPAELAQDEALLAGGVAEILQEPEMIPAAEFESQENYKEDIISQGDPKIAVYGVSQVWWELAPGEISAERIRGVYILDYISETDAKTNYAQKDIYGIKTDIDFDELMGDKTSGAFKAIFDKVKHLFGKDKQGKKELPRIRYRRKAKPGEQRSQWFTLVGGQLVKAMECPYKKSFDISLGIYPFFARPSNDHLEGIPDIAYMIQPQVISNAIDSLVMEFIESFPYGTYTTSGGDEPNTNVTSGGGPKIITSDRPLTPNTPVGLGQEVFQMKSDMRYMIQYFGRANQLQPGTRSQDANTATQASIAQAYGQKLTSFNQFNDAGSWQMFLNDLLSLLGQFVKERRQIRANQMQTVQGPMGAIPMAIGQEFDFTSAYLEYVDSVICEPEDLQRKTDEESKRDLTAMMDLVNPDDPAETEWAKKLKKRYVELMNEQGIEYPIENVAVPGIDSATGQPLGNAGPGLEGVKTPPGTDQLPQNMPTTQKEAITQINQGV